MALLSLWARAKLDVAGALERMKGLRVMSFSAEDRANFAKAFLLRSRYGRTRSRYVLPHQGPREIARRKRQIERGMLQVSPPWRGRA